MNDYKIENKIMIFFLALSFNFNYKKKKILKSEKKRSDLDKLILKFLYI